LKPGLVAVIEKKGIHHAIDIHARMLLLHKGKEGIRLIDGIKILPLKILRKWSLSLQFDVCHLIVSLFAIIKETKTSEIPRRSG
jgi:hypothetical protein